MVDVESFCINSFGRLTTSTFNKKKPALDVTRNVKCSSQINNLKCVQRRSGLVFVLIMLLIVIRG